MFSERHDGISDYFSAAEARKPSEERVVAIKRVINRVDGHGFDKLLVRNDEHVQKFLRHKFFSYRSLFFAFCQMRTDQRQ